MNQATSTSKQSSKAQTPQPHKNSAAGLFTLLDQQQILSAPPPLEWLLQDYILKQSQCHLIGETTIGKTFFSVALALSIATGRDFMGRPVSQGTVIYINAEGQTGMRYRVKAWEQEFGPFSNIPFYLSERSTNFLDLDHSVANVAKSIDVIAKNHNGKIAAIFVDTLHRNMLGDENSSHDFGLFMANLDRLCQRYGATGIVNHHPGHSAKDRGRGSSSQRASLDSELLLIKENNQTLLKHTKLKDGGPLQSPAGFRLQQIEIPWLDSRGKKITSCIPEFYEPVDLASSTAKHIPENPALAVKALIKALADIKETTRETWKSEFSALYKGEESAMTKAFSRALNDLERYRVVTEIAPNRYSIGDCSMCPWTNIKQHLLANRPYAVQ